MSRARDRADGDFAGKELIFDADGDTSITADTDDQIDIKIAGNDTAIVAADSVKIRSDNAGLIFRRTTSEADIAKIQYVNGNPSLDIGADGKNVRFTNGSSYAETMRVGTNGQITIQDGDLVIGTSGHGIDFSATGDGSGTDSSELLDDYEEGTWTPTLTNGGSVSINAATYTKIGNIIRIGFYIEMSSIPNNSTAFYIGGLPYNVDFTSGGGNDHYHGAGSITYVGSHNVLGFGMLPPTPYTGQATMYFHRGDGSSSAVLNSNMTGCPYLILATSYKTA